MGGRRGYDDGRRGYDDGRRGYDDGRRGYPDRERGYEDRRYYNDRRESGAGRRDFSTDSNWRGNRFDENWRGRNFSGPPPGPCNYNDNWNSYGPSSYGYDHGNYGYNRGYNQHSDYSSHRQPSHRFNPYSRDFNSSNSESLPSSQEQNSN